MLISRCKTNLTHSYGGVVLVILWHYKITPDVTLKNYSHTHHSILAHGWWKYTFAMLCISWIKGSYNRIRWKNSWSAYLTLKNDFHTPCNTISSMVNVCIRYVIFLTKSGILSQCEISTVRFITCNAISICWLQKKRGGGGGGKSLYDKLTPGVLISCCTMAHTHSYGELFYYIMKELRPGVLISRWK